MYIHELLEQKNSVAINWVSQDASLLEMAAELSKQRTTCLVVEDDFSDMIGIVTERDLVKAVSTYPEKLSEIRIVDIMSTNIQTAAPEDDVVETLNLMSNSGIRHMPVVSNGNLLAVVNISDFQIICDHLGVLASTDALTGLANRRQFMHAMETELSRYNRKGNVFSVAMLDIDFFKKINDTHGHNAGDMILCKFADIFRSNLREYDFPGRLGGEEFAILLPETKLNDAVSACQHVLDEVRKIELVHDIGVIRCTASFGVTTIAPCTESVESMLNYADQLLYQAKNNGRNQIVAEPFKADSSTMPADNLKTA